MAKRKNKLRLEAKGRECQIRIPNVCNKNPETTVLCHLNNKRLLGVGMGQKVDDMFGAWGCANCHDIVDLRVILDIWTPDAIQILFYEGVLRTQNILRKEGLL